jgi:hypothetical protein
MLFALLMFAANLAAVITVDLEDAWRESRRRSVCKALWARLTQIEPASYPARSLPVLRLGWLGL